MTSLAALVAALVVAVPVAPGAPGGSATTLRPLAVVNVVGSGPIAWSRVGARARP